MAVDGDFLRMLDGLGYRFFDDDGNVYSVDYATERPTVDHACINVSVDESVEITMLLPVDPVMAATPARHGTVSKVGVALDGVPIFSDAPEIQVTGHMPALDTCGGHVGPAADGSEVYHYHASESFPNLPPCLIGVQAQDNFTTTATAGIGARRAGEDSRSSNAWADRRSLARCCATARKPINPKFSQTEPDMKPMILTAILLASSATAAPSQTDPRLAEVAEFFAAADIIAGPDVVDCTLSQGEQTECFSITLAADPQTYKPGPWCPKNVSDGAEAGGIWFLDGETVDVDGDFITKLANIYGDTNWQLYDPDTGDIRYTGTLEECQAAARPDVDPAYQNYCVQCLPETLPGAATVTFVIPFKPVAATAVARTGENGSGVAYNGVRLDGPAPVDAILEAYTIAPFDDCGGHVNPHVGYHYHAVTDCLDAAPHAAEAGDHGAQIGIAMDGQAILSHLMADGSILVGLDQCNGHTIEDGSYHYHVGEAGSNAILGCLTAQTGCTLEEAGGTCDASARRPRP